LSSPLIESAASARAIAGLAACAHERNISRIDLTYGRTIAPQGDLYRRLGFERLRSIVSVLAGPPLLGRVDAQGLLDRGADASSSASMPSSRGAAPIAFHVRFAEPETWRVIPIEVPNATLTEASTQ